MSRTTAILPQVPPATVLYERMFLIRTFETVMEEEAKAGRLTGTFHSSVGQEAVAVGACACLTHDDLIVSNHRGHGHFLAKGGDVFKLMAELFGREAGYSGGKGGTQHVAGVDVGFMGSNGITSGGIPVATGLAYAMKRREQPNVVISFFGDGAANQGIVHESLNMSAVFGLPIIYLCENNGWGMSTPVKAVTAGNIAHRGEAYGLLYKSIDGNDVDVVLDNVRAALSMVMHGELPTLIECRTWRVRGHSRSDQNLYRDKSAEQQWQQRDPLQILRKKILDRHRTAGDELAAVEAKVHKKVSEALEKCRALPPARPEAAFEKVYVTVPEKPAVPIAARPQEFDQKAYWQAIQEAMCEAMDRDERYYVFGEDVAEYGGCFKVTRGMFERYGKNRIVNTPVSEAGIVGLSVGAAMAGMRPIAEIMFMDFILLALDQLMNHAAKFHYIYNGQVKIPLVVRTPMGGYRGYGATHSQCLDTLLMKMPGLRVVTPWSPRDAKGLLKTCLAAEDPVVFIEHKALYGTTGPVPKDEEYIPLGKANIVREGKHVTLCANSYMVSLSLQAAEILAKEGVEAEVVDMRCLAPLDRDTVAKSAAKTQALVIVEEGHYTLGLGAEIAASVQELAFGYLDTPILRVAAADTPIPSAIELERAVLPNVEKIVATVRRALQARG